MNQRSIDTIVLNKLDNCNITDMVKDALRYRAMKRFSVGQFAALQKDYLLGHQIDAQMDMAVLDMHVDKFVDKTAKQAAKQAAAPK